MSQKQYLTWNNPFASCEKWLRREENGFYHILENLESRKKRKSSAARSSILHLYPLERVLQATQIIFNKINTLEDELLSFSERADHQNTYICTAHESFIVAQIVNMPCPVPGPRARNKTTIINKTMILSNWVGSKRDIEQQSFPEEVKTE